MNYKIILVFILLLFLMLLSGCMPGDGSYSKEDPASFFSGIWHGWIAPISLIRGLLNANIRIYEVHNSGWIYDFGFYMAILGGFGGITLSRKKKKE